MEHDRSNGRRIVYRRKESQIPPNSSQQSPLRAGATRLNKAPRMFFGIRTNRHRAQVLWVEAAVGLWAVGKEQGMEMRGSTKNPQTFNAPTWHARSYRVCWGTPVQPCPVSSVGQSHRLITGRSEVRDLDGAPVIK